MPATMRPITLLNSAIVLAATASFVVAQSPSIPPTAPALNSPASATMTTTTTAPSTSTTSTSSSAMPSEAEMMKMMTELAKLNENHKLLASMDGNWDYVIKLFIDAATTEKPQE